MAGLSKSGTKPKLQDLDEIFGLIGEETESKTNNANVKNKVVYIEIKKLKPFNNHLFDRHQLSVMNDWFDENDEVYIYFKREEMQKELGISERTVKKVVQELINHCLLEEKK